MADIHLDVLLHGIGSQRDAVIAAAHRLYDPVAVAVALHADGVLIPGPQLVVGVPVVAGQPCGILLPGPDVDLAVLIEPLRDMLPPAVIEAAQVLDHLGMLRREVGPLPGILPDVVEFPAVDQPPVILHHAAVAVLDGLVDPLFVHDQRTVSARQLASLQLGREVDAVEIERTVGRQAAKPHERGQQVDVGRQGREVAPAGQLAVLVVDEAGHAVTALVGRGLSAAHARIVEIAVAAHETRPVVGHVDEDRVVGNPQPLQLVAQTPQVLVDAGNHAEEARPEIGHAGIAVLLRIAVRHQVPEVGRVGRNVAEEGFVAVLADEADGLIEPHVGTVSLVKLPMPVVHVDVVETVVAPVVGILPDTAAPVDDALLEAAEHRMVGVAVTEMPLAENARAVAVLAEELGDGRLLVVHDRAALQRMPYPRAGAVAARHQRRTRRRTRGVGMEVRQPHRLAVEPVDIRRADIRIAVAGHVAVALIVGKHQHHVGLPVLRRGCGRGQTHRSKQNLPFHRCDH